MSFMMWSLQRSGQNHFLRVFIDSKDGIGLTDCEKVTNSINDVLDEADPIKQEYFLEVSSPRCWEDFKER